jgi:nucleotide-binding universal stress UspA family protein
MKKISAAFDGLRFSESTLAHSIALAKASKAVLSGVFLESFLYHSYNLEDVIEKDGITKGNVKRHMREDKKVRENCAKIFETACKAAKLKYALHRDIGLTILEVVRESIYSDLLLINNEDTFSTMKQLKPSLFICELLSEVKCPLLVVPTTYHKIERVVILYDGRPRAVTAIKMFHHLFPHMKDLPIEVLFVSAADYHRQRPDQELMDEFINCHYPQATSIELRGDHKVLILNHLEKTDPDTLIVMGANQRSRVSRLFTPSLVEKVLEKIDLPVFIVNS